MGSAIQVKILSYKSPQRFAVKRTLFAALTALRRTYPGLELCVSEVRGLTEIEQYTSVIILPSLMINNELVCIGRFPKKEEVVRWLQEAME